MTEIHIYSFAVSGKYIFAGTWSGIFLSTNNGVNWTKINSGFPPLTVLAPYSLAVSDSTIFCGTYENGVWRRPISEIVGINNPESQQRKVQLGNLKILSQKPNNTNVTIEFSLSVSSQVAVNIYNLSGREIVTLVNRNLKAGNYRFSWNTRNIAQGCYVAKMHIGTNTFVKNIPIYR
jgi:hypothetical protein